MKIEILELSFKLPQNHLEFMKTLKVYSFLFFYVLRIECFSNWSNQPKNTKCLPSVIGSHYWYTKTLWNYLNLTSKWQTNSFRRSKPDQTVIYVTLDAIFSWLKSKSIFFITKNPYNFSKRIFYSKLITQLHWMSWL